MGVYPSVKSSLCLGRSDQATLISFGERLVLKKQLDQVNASRPSHFYVLQAEYLSQPPFATLILLWEYLIIKGNFKSDQGLRSSLGASFRWYVWCYLLFVSAFSIQQKKARYIKISF